MIPVQDKYLYLDDYTTQSTEYLQILEQNDSVLLAFINVYDNSITLHRWESGKLYKKIYFDKEGSNGVGTLFAFCFADSSIYLYNQWMRKLFITDLNAKLRKSIDIDLIRFSSDNLFPPTLFPLTLSPISKIGEKIMLTGFSLSAGENKNETEDNMPTTAVYNLKNGEIMLCNGYPSIYHKGYWGADPNYRVVRYCIDSHNRIALSYAVDENIYVLDSLGDAKTIYFAGAQEQKEKIKPIDRDRYSSNITREEIYKFYMENIIYGGILYDKYNRVFYRICSMPNYNYPPESHIIEKALHVIILDEQFRKIGESTLPDAPYLILSYFISPEGLHVQVNSEDDDIMKFKTFKIQKK
jgi:hypothetical protein